MNYLLFSHWVLYSSLWHHGLQHVRLLYPSPSPGACSNSCPLSQWCCWTISSSATLPGAVVGDPTHDKVMRRRPDTQGHSGYKGPSRLTLASAPPCIFPTFLLLFLFALLQILVLPAESSHAPLSLNKDQLKTLINKSPRHWYPKGARDEGNASIQTVLLAFWFVLANVYSYCKEYLWLF